MSYRTIRKTLVLLLFVLFSATAVFAESDEIFVVPIAKIPKNFKKPEMTSLRPYSAQANPAVMMITQGMTAYTSPRYDFSISTSMMNIYRKGSQVYLYATVANFESKNVTLGVQYKLSGSKTLNIKQQKSFKGGYIYAVFIKRPLAPTPGIYAMQVSLVQGFNVVDSLYSRFLVADTY